MRLITLDFETYYGDDYSLSARDMTTERYVRDERFKVHGFGFKIGDGKSVWVPGKHAATVLERLKLEDAAVCGHNLQFDGFILGERYGIYPKLYLDTLGMSRAMIGPHSPRHGLKYAAQILCGMTKMDELAKTYNKRELSPQIEAALADYTVGLPRDTGRQDGFLEAGDVELTYAILQKMLPHFPKKELKALDWTVRAFTQPKLWLDTQMLENYILEVRDQKEFAVEEVFYSAEMPGFKYLCHPESSCVYRSAYQADLEQPGVEEISREVYLKLRREGWAADVLNDAQHEQLRKILASNPQFAAILETHGVVPPTKISPKTGKVSFAFAKTDEGLKALLEHDNPEVQALAAARLEVKSTIEETRAILYHSASERGAWPVGYNYAGAQVTQRYSGNKGGGGNPQNLKRGGTLRRAIYAALGFTCGVADLSQIEARLTLWLGMQITGPDGEEAKALEVMRLGGDIYGWFGTKIYGYAINKKDTPLERQIAKSAVLGLGFGMGAERFIEYCKQSGIKDIDARFAEDIVKLYRSTFPGVRKFWGQCTKAVNMMLDGNTGVGLPFDGVTLVRTGLDPLFHDNGIELPNGLFIKYPQLEKDAEGQITYRDGNSRAKLFGGKICENVVQAVAALIMREQKVELNKTYWTAMTTHDELVSIVPEGPEPEAEYVSFVTELMTRDISYLPGLPLGVEVETAVRYGDAK